MLGGDLETPERRKSQAEKRFGGVARMISLVGPMAPLMD